MAKKQVKMNPQEPDENTQPHEAGTNRTPSRKARPYALHTDPIQLITSFYERFDETFLYNQAATLRYALEQGDDFKRLVEERSVQWGSVPVGDKYFESLRAQFYFMVLHQFEALFALLIVPYQGVPDWIYLTSYRTEDIKQAMIRYTEHRLPDIAPRVPSDSREFVQSTVYSGFLPNDESQKDAWNKNLDVIDWLIHRLAREYLENAAAYNSYKHGLRVMTGHTWFSMHLNDSSGTPTGQGIGRSSDDSLIFLELKKQDQHIEVYETVQHFSPDESFEYLVLMAALLRTIKLTRLARLKEDPSLLSQVASFAQINTDQFISEYAGKHFRFSLTI